MAVTKKTEISGKQYFRAEAICKVKGKVIHRASKRFEIGERLLAEDWVDKTLADMKRGVWTKSSKSPLGDYTLRDCYEEWLKVEAPDRRRQTLDAVESRSRYILESPLAEIPILQIEKTSIDQWFDWLHNHPTAENAKRLTFEREFKELKKYIHWFIDIKCKTYVSPIDRNHRKRIFIKGRKRTKIEDIDNFYLNPEELNKFFSDLKNFGDPVYYRLAFTMALSGFGLGEALAICDRSIDRKNRKLRMIQTMITGGRSRFEIQKNEAKNEFRIRRVDLTPMLEEMLTEIQRENEELGLAGRETIFFNRFGRIPSPSTIRERYRESFISVGMPEDIGGSTHIFRHTFATLKLLLTKNIEEVKFALGHSTSQHTKRYAKASIFENEKDRPMIDSLLDRSEYVGSLH